MTLMPIGGNTAQPTEIARETEAVRTGGAHAAPAKPQMADCVQISERSREMARMQTATTEAPDPRAARVENLRSLVNAGAYSPDPERIARRMLDEVW